MNIIKLLDSFNIDHFSEEEKDVYMSRKEAFRNMGKWSRNVAAAALPLGLVAALPSKSFANAKRVNAHDVLNYALTLEYLEYHFYNHSLLGDDTDLGLSASEEAAITAIRDHEKAHVDFLTETIDSLGETPIEDPGYDAFDFRAGGLFEDVYTNKGIFMAVAQAFEDTGVRAYKGQAGNITNDDAALENTLLTAALQIHSVEARHAAHIRRMRIKNGFAAADEKGWVTTPDYSGLGNSDQMAATMGVYAGEDNKTHLGVDATTTTEVDALGVEEGWDEPLTSEAVYDIARPFAPFLPE